MIPNVMLQPTIRGPIRAYDSNQKSMRRLGRVPLPDFSQYGVYVWVLLLAVVTITNTRGCASVPKRKPLPEELSKIAKIPDISRARIWGDERQPARNRSGR